MSVNSCCPEADELVELLQSQLQLVRTGKTDSDAMQKLCENADPMIESLSLNTDFESEQLAEKRTRIQELYHELILAVTAEKSQIENDIQAVQKGRKVVGLYRNNMQKNQNQ